MTDAQVETRVLPLFPTFVWLAQLPAATAESVNTPIRGVLRQRLASREQAAARQLLQSEQTLHQDPALAALLPHLDAAVKGALEFMKIRYERFVITGCWANVAETGLGHKPHCHPNNFLSGVYYVDADAGGDSITFHDPRPQPNIFMPPTRELTNETAGQVTLRIKPGAMVLFPAWLLHSVGPNASASRRISIAFNIMFDRFAETMSPPMWDGTL